MCYSQKIQQGAQLMGISLSEDQLLHLVQYLEMLIKWNKAYNLTAIHDPEKMIHLHLLDSLATLPFIKGAKVIDVGSGPGLPGMILAICLPDKAFTLLDSNGKKTRFLTQVKMELGLKNVTICNERVEKHALQGYYDHVISRAFASLEDMINWTLPLVNETGNFLAMKGQYPQDELSDLPDTVTIKEIISLTVPNINAERHLVFMESNKK